MSSDDFLLSTTLSVLLGVQDATNSQAWKRFVDTYRPPIVRRCVELGLQSADAEDMAQEILLKLLQRMSSFQYDPTRSFRRWLRTVTHNAVIDSLRKHHRRPFVVSGDSCVAQLLDNVEARRSPVNSLVDELTVDFQKDLLREAGQAVRHRVLQRTWHVYEMVSQGNSAEQVAQHFEMKRATVYKVKSKVIDMIREELAKIVHTTPSNSRH